MRTLKPSSSLLSCVVIGLGSLSVPSAISSIRVRTIQTPLVIQTSKIEPPRVAFDSVVKTIKSFQSWPELEALPHVNLNEVVELQRPAKTEGTRYVVLQPMIFQRENLSGTERTFASIDQSIESTRLRTDHLNDQEQKRIELAQEKFGTLDQDWSLPSFRELAAQKIAELQNSTEAAKDQPQIKIEVTDEGGNLKTPESFRTADVRINQNSNSNGFQVSGSFELAGGLPYGPGWRVQIARYEDGVRQEIGTSNQAGQFHIQVPELSGAVYAQLIESQNGVVLGEGSLRLSSYDDPHRLRSSKIVIKKSASEVAGRYRSIYDLASGPGKKSGSQQRLYSPTLDQETQTDASGSFQFSRVAAGSWLLLRGEGQGTARTLSLVRAGGDKNFTSFPTPMIDALREMIRDQGLVSTGQENDSVIWGQILQDGKPVGKAEVLLEQFPDIKPVYFNPLMLPDASLKMTGENGYFAFIDIPVGLHSVVARQAKLVLGHNNVVVDEGSVSHAEIEVSFRKEESTVKVFDAFSGSPLAAVLEMQSLEDALEVQGSVVLTLPSVERKSFVRVHPKDEAYVPFLSSYDELSDFVHIPLITKSWMDSIRGQRRINMDASHGVIVGFVQEEDFEVFLSHEDDFSKENVVYFDSQGNISERGVAGGGFMLWNTKPGVQSVVVMGTRSERLQTEVTTVDELSISILKFR